MERVLYSAFQINVSKQILHVGKEGDKEERNRLNEVYQEGKKGIAALEIKQILSCFSVLKVWRVDIYML